MDGAGSDSGDSDTPREEEEVEEEEEEEEDEEIWNGDLERGRLKYLVFMVMTMLLLPLYSIVLLFSIWVWYLLPNSLSVMGVLTSAVLPGALWIGFKSAKNQKMVRTRDPKSTFQPSECFA